MIAMLLCALASLVPPGGLTETSRMLDRLAAQVEQSLWNTPDEPMSESGRPATLGALSLAANWPHEWFRAPLLRLLESKDPEIATAAAGALAGYLAPEIDSVLLQHTSDTRTLHMGCLVYSMGDAVTHMLQSRRAPDYFESAEDILPLNSLGEPAITRINDAEREMTLPIAVTTLNSPSLSERFQAVCWLLFQCKLAPDLQPLRDAWPLLRDEARAAFCRTFVFYVGDRLQVGGDGLRAELESHIGEREFPAARAWLLLAAAELGSVRARSEAFAAMIDWIAADRVRVKGPPAASTAADETDVNSAWERAYDELHPLGSALAHGLPAGSLEITLEWVNSSDPYIRDAAVTALAGSNDWRAVTALVGRLPMDSEARSAAKDLCKRDDCTDAIRWYCIESTGRMIESTLDSLDVEATPTTRWDISRAGWFPFSNAAEGAARQLADLNSLLTDITGVDLGPTGHAMAGVHRDEAIAAGKRWLTWIAHVPADARGRVTTDTSR